MIKIITTGGTIDTLNYTDEKDAPREHKSAIRDLLKTARLTVDYVVKDLFAKDSRLINEHDRELLVNECRNSKEEEIVVTHGTMTLTETAEYLQKAQLGKTIVLVGAMLPFNKEKSDALFNLGAAIIAGQTLPAGVYVVMNGKVFEAGNVRKDF